MASNFRISLFRIRDSIYLELEGEFDGNSARELLNALMAHGTRSRRIHLDTKNLERVYPFGRAVFLNNLDTFIKKCRHLVFIGENSRNIFTV